jgi:bromodomain-containing factor 1
LRICYRPNEDLPVAAEQSDDLFGEEPNGESVDAVAKQSLDDIVDDPDVSKPALAATDLSANGPPTPADSQTVDAAPTSDAAPVTEPSSGIEGVAKFIPSDANLNQPVVSPSEPLGDGEAHITEDTELPDAPSLATETHSATVPEPQVSEDSKPGAIDGVTASTSESNSLPTTDLLNGVADQSKPDDTKPASEQASDLPLANGSISDSTAAAESAPSMDAPTAQSSAALPVDTSMDQEMSDAPSAGTVRAREEDDMTSEPSAKRTKTGDDVNGEAQAEFEKTEPIGTPQPASITSNGGTNGIAVPVVRPQNTPRISSGPISKSQKAFLIEKMKNTKKVKSAFWFTKPVDYVALNIPHYPTVVKQPMDLTTIEHKLKNDQYASVDALVSDFELMVTNCFTFNGINHAASVSAQNLRAYFMKQMQMCPTGQDALAKPKSHVAKKASPKPAALPRPEPAKPAAPVKSPAGETFALLPDGTPMIRRDSTAGRPKRAVIPPAPRDLPYSQSKPKRKEAQTGLKFCEHILDEFRKPKYDRFAAPFRIPVDPVALNIPQYFSIIKHPMDISTITQKLKGGQYASAEEFRNDFELMFTNCFKFNPAGNIVHDMGRDFQEAFHGEWSKKDIWIKRHTPQSQRASPVSDVSDGDESDDAHEEDDEHDNNEATISLLREQLAAMQNMVASISGGKRASPKATSNKKKSKSSSTVASKPSKKSGGSSSISRPTIKTSSSKPKKQRLVTYDEKQEISNATENMSAEQVERLTNIITENVAKYKDMAGDDVELEIDDLPNEVQHKLLRYVRSIFPKAEPVEMDANAIDDDYEPEKPSARSGGAAKKKHKPMKKHEQEDRIRQLKEQMAAMGSNADGDGGAAAASAPQHADSSDDEDSESSEEE